MPSCRADHEPFCPAAVVRVPNVSVVEGHDEPFDFQCPQGHVVGITGYAGPGVWVSPIIQALGPVQCSDEVSSDTVGVWLRKTTSGPLKLNKA